MLAAISSRLEAVCVTDVGNQVALLLQVFDDVPAEALASARRIAALAPGAARMNKQVLRALKMPPALDGKAPAAIEMIVNGPHDPYAYADSAEHREGITAFLAKRPPVF